MQVFINETSIHGQYHNPGEFENYIKAFIGLTHNFKKAVTRKNHTIPYKVYLDRDNLSNYCPINGANFLSCLNSIKDKSLTQAFKDVLFNKMNAINWRDEQSHSVTDTFSWVEIVTNTSVAELAERKLQLANLKCCLFNFQESKFSGSMDISVVKNSSDEVSLSCVENEEQLMNFLENKLSISDFIYDDTGSCPPKDSQTILNNNNRFVATTLPPQRKRIVYREKTTGCYWYVDQTSAGKSAHLEVFNKRGEHIGVASLDGNIDFTKRKNYKIPI